MLIEGTGRDSFFLFHVAHVFLKVPLKIVAFPNVDIIAVHTW